MNSEFTNNNLVSLLQKISEGHEPSFRQFFDYYKEFVYFFLLRITKSKEVAEELTMDIFMKLWVGRDWVIEINNIEAFLKKVAYNKAVDFLRYTARHKKIQKAISLKMAQEPLDTSYEDKLIDKDYQYILEKAIRSLSPKRRLVYTLSREDGLTHDQIAKQLGLSINTVSNHIKESLKSIRDFLYRNNIQSGLIFFILLIN